MSGCQSELCATLQGLSNTPGASELCASYPARLARPQNSPVAEHGASELCASYPARLALSQTVLPQDMPVASESRATLQGLPDLRTVLPQNVALHTWCLKAACRLPLTHLSVQLHSCPLKERHHKAQTHLKATLPTRNSCRLAGWSCARPTCAELQIRGWAARPWACAGDVGWCSSFLGLSCGR